MDPHDPAAPGAGTPADAWLAVSDGLISGLHHALNNRMAALTAVAQVLESDLPPDHPLGSALSAEVERLERTVSLLRALPRGRGRPEPVQLGEVTETVRQLFALHHEVRDVALSVEGEAAVYPLWVDPALLTHALLTLAGAAGWRARALRGGRVAIRCSGDAERVTVEVRAEGEPGGGAEDEQDAGSPLARVDARAAGEMLRDAGAEVETDEAEGGWATTLRLLTLPAARRRESAAGGSGGA